MTRAQQSISLGLLVLSLYLACYLQLIPFGSKVQDEIIPVLPLWTIVSFGAYLLFKLGLEVFTFNDVPDAQKELLREIDMAREELKAKGVDID